MNYLSKSENRIAEIPTIKIRPNKTQPRRIFEEDKLRDLAKSIEENGILQPLTVDRESAVLALIENLQRRDLGIFEEARGISRLIRRYGLTQEQAAVKLGKSQSSIANKLRLLNLTYDEQDWIVQAGLSERHARALLRIYDQELRKEALSKIIADNLNVAQSEELIENMLCNSGENEKKGTRKIIIRDIRIFINTINKAVLTMKEAGIDAVYDKKDSGDYLEYTVKIPKPRVEKPA